MLSAWTGATLDAYAGIFTSKRHRISVISLNHALWQKLCAKCHQLFMILWQYTSQVKAVPDASKACGLKSDNYSFKWIQLVISRYVTSFDTSIDLALKGSKQNHRLWMIVVDCSQARSRPAERWTLWTSLLLVLLNLEVSGIARLLLPVRSGRRAPSETWYHPCKTKEDQT